MLTMVLSNHVDDGAAEVDWSQHDIDVESCW
jgi:hypothetical protein